LVNRKQPGSGGFGGELGTAFGLAGGAHFQASFQGFGDGEDALDEAFDIAGFVNKTGFPVFYVLGLAALWLADEDVGGHCAAAKSTSWIANSDSFRVCCDDRTVCKFLLIVEGNVVDGGSHLTNSETSQPDNPMMEHSLENCKFTKILVQGDEDFSSGVGVCKNGGVARILFPRA
jgi:hypothetical protein